MRFITTSLFLIFSVYLFGQNTDTDAIELAKELQAELQMTKVEIEKLNLKIDNVEKGNNGIVGVSNTIISWSGRIFAIFAALLSIATVYSGYQISQIRKIKNDLEDLYTKSKKEIEDQKSELESLRTDFEKDKEDSLKLLFPLIRGQWYFYQGDYEKSLSAFLQAKKIQPNHPEIIRNLYRILANTGKTEEAIQNLEKLHKEFPDDKVIKYRLAQTYRRNGQLENAEIVIKDAAINDKYPPALYEYGSILMNSNRLKEAEEIFIEANRQFLIDEGVTKYWVFVNLSLTQLLLGKIEESKRNADKVFEIVSTQLKLAPSNAQLYSNLGLSYLLKGENPQMGKGEFVKSTEKNLPSGIAKSMINKIELINRVKESPVNQETIKLLKSYLEKEKNTVANKA